MSETDLAAMVGTRVRLSYSAARTGGLKVDCKILEAKTAYGKDRYLVTPIKGTGSVWVNAESTTPIVDP